MLRRVDMLQKAVIQAREEANGREVQQRQVANAIFSYLFAD
jgi:hypothetical protein